MEKCVFTICAKNYLGLALAQAESIKLYNPDVEHYIFIADEFENSEYENANSNIFCAKDIVSLNNDQWVQMSFKYNLVEFCTAIKPFCFMYLLNKGYGKVAYFDPDVFIFNSIECIFTLLDEYKAVVTPHNINTQYIPISLSNDSMRVQSGVFNLGFIAFRSEKAIDKILEWWGERLIHYAYSDVTRGLFTDQKWMDLLPCMLNSDELYISKNLGMNYAPWNYSERELLLKDGEFYVQQKHDAITIENKLIFFHCSGYDYKNLEQYQGTNENNKEAIRSLLKICNNRLQDVDFTQYLGMRYTYSCYANNFPIIAMHRYLYGRLCDEGINVGNPFAPSSKFYSLLKRNKLLVKKDNRLEKAKPEQVENLNAKIKILDSFTKLLRNILSADKYMLLCKLLNKYFRYENQARLLDAEYEKFRIK